MSQPEGSAASGSMGPVLAVVGVVLAVLVAGTTAMVVLPVIALVGLGGAGSQGGNFANNCLPPGVAGGNNQAPAEVRAEQIRNALAIAAAVKEAGMPGSAARIAIIAAVGESDLVNVGHGDAAGPDSRGLFQQRSGWGTEAQRMDPRHATLSFLLGPKHDGLAHGPGGTGLAAIPDWEAMQPSEAIHAVQVNADPNHYTQYVARAEQIAAEAKVSFAFPGNPHPRASASSGASASPGASGSVGSAVGAGYGCDESGVNVTITDGPCPLDDPDNPLALQGARSCTDALRFLHEQMVSGSRSWYRQCLYLTEVAYGWPPNGVPTAQAQGEIMRSRGLLSTDTSSIPRGALLFWAGGSAGHVAIYDGLGHIYSNDAPVNDGRIGRVAWDYPTKVWGQQFMGWAPPLFVSS